MTDSDDMFPVIRQHGEQCMHEDRACRYDRERSELMLALRDLRKAVDAQGEVIVGLREDLARGSERFRRSDETSAELHAVRALLDKEKMERMASERMIHSDLSGIKETLGIISASQQQVNRIVYGACGFTLLAVLGVLVGMALAQ